MVGGARGRVVGTYRKHEEISSMIRYCTRCVMPETKPDILFDEEGVCSACRHFSLRGSVDWDVRRAELVELLDRYRSKDGSNYDCCHPCQRRQGQHLPGGPDARSG
jgi:hypothetical protein